MSEARILADVLYKRDIYVVKHWRKVWGNELISRYGRIVGSAHVVIDHEPEFMPLEEQQERFAQRINEQGLFEFLLRPAIREREVSQAVIPISIANLDRDDETGSYQFPDSDRVACFRAALESHAGTPAATVLKELESSLPARRAAQVAYSPRLREQQPPQRRHEGNQHNATDAQSVKTPDPVKSPLPLSPDGRHSTRQRQRRQWLS
jgi:hypothetical protein